MNLAGLVADYFMADKLDLATTTRLLCMEVSELQREVYMLLPGPDRDDHQYLVVSEKVKTTPSPESLYMAEAITIQEYEDLKYPGKE